MMVNDAITTIAVGDVIDLSQVRTIEGLRQPRESALCGQYAAAYLLDLEPLFLEQWIGHGRTFPEEVCLALNKICQRTVWVIQYSPYLLLHCRAMLLVKTTQQVQPWENGLHWLAYDPQRQGIYDPLQGSGTWVVRSIISEVER